MSEEELSLFFSPKSKAFDEGNIIMKKDIVYKNREYEVRWIYYSLLNVYRIEIYKNAEYVYSEKYNPSDLLNNLFDDCYVNQIKNLFNNYEEFKNKKQLKSNKLKMLEEWDGVIN